MPSMRPLEMRLSNQARMTAARHDGLRSAIRIKPHSDPSAAVIPPTQFVEDPKELSAHLLANPADLMRFRIVVPAIEAWLLADREAMAQFLGVDPRRLPQVPEGAADVKAVVIDLARRSSLRSIRDDMLPHPQSGRREGPGYATRLIEFINAGWEPKRGSSACGQPAASCR